MATSRPVARGIRVWLGFVFIVATAALMLLGQMGTSAAPAQLPPDVQRLGLQIGSDEWAGTIQADEAVRRAIEVVGEGGLETSAQIDAFPIQATDARSVDLGARAIEMRMIWLVRFSGFALYFPGPPSADGTSTIGHTAHFAYVLLDAVTGEPLDLQYWE